MLVSGSDDKFMGLMFKNELDCEDIICLEGKRRHFKKGKKKKTSEKYRTFEGWQCLRWQIPKQIFIISFPWIELLYKFL